MLNRKNNGMNGIPKCMLSKLLIRKNDGKKEYATGDHGMRNKVSCPEKIT
jgi:hypothetical protein